MNIKDQVNKRFNKYSVELGIEEFICNICFKKFECDTTVVELAEHLKQEHPKLPEFK